MKDRIPALCVPIRRLRILAAAAALLLNSCYHGADQISPSAKLLWETPATQDLLALPAPIPTHASNEGALDLPGAVSLALSNNPETRAAWLAALAAAEQKGVALSPYYPEIDASVFLRRERSDFAGNPVLIKRTVEQPAIELTYTLLDFGDRSGTARAAQELLTSANFQFNRTVQQVVYQVHRRFFALAAAQGAVEANKHSKDDAEQSMRVAQKGFEVGIRPKSDLLLAESSLRRAEFQLASSSATLERSRAGLAEVLGVQIGPDLEILTPDLNALHSAFAPSDRKVSDLIESALSKRPDLLSTYAEARAADADIDVIIGKALPRLVTRMNASVTETNGSTDEEKNYDLGIGVEVPLFTGFSYYYALRKAEAERDRSMQLARQGQLSVASQVWSAFFNSKAAEDQVASAEALLGASQESQRVLLRGYQEGSSSLLDLLTAQTSLALARQTMIAAQADWAVSIAELALACGELKPEPVLTK